MTTAKIVISGDDTPLRRTLASARQQMNQFGSEAMAPFTKLRDAMGNLGNIMAGLGAVKLVGIVDGAAQVQARLRDVAGSIQQAAQAQQALFAASQRLGVSYEDMAGGFARMLPAVREMGGGAKEAARLAEIMAMTARLSGASSQEAAAGAQQFAQALASGVLQGDELKSILENNSTLSRALAEGLGVSVGQLRDLGAQGKLTADVVTKALLGQYDEINSRSQQLPLTVGQAFTQVQNAFQAFTSSASDSTGVFSGLASVISGVARVLDSVRAATGSVMTESERLQKDNKIKAWGETVGAILAYVVDMARSVWEVFNLVGTGIGGLAAAAVAVARGEFSEARSIFKAMQDDAAASVQRIQNLLTGGEGSALRSYALNSGQQSVDLGADAALRSGGASKSTKGGAAKGSADKSQMPTLEFALEQQRAALVEQGKLFELSKQMELGYWREVLNTRNLSANDRLAVERKVAQLSVEIGRAATRERAQGEQQALDAWRDMELAKLEGQRAASDAMRANDQISKARALQDQMLFEEQRLAIQLQYLQRKLDMERAMQAQDPNFMGPRAPSLGEQQIMDQMGLEKQKSQNTQTQLGGKLEKETGGLFNMEEWMEGTQKSFSNGLASMLGDYRNFHGALNGMLMELKASFIKNVIADPLVAAVSGWAKMLAAKLGFVAQEKAADAAGAATTVAIKGAETAAVVSGNAVQAGTGAAAAVAPIPIVGPALALAAMAAIFAAVSGMGSKVKSARNGYDIPAGLNPMVQLHEEEMVLPKEQANAVRDMARGGGQDDAPSGPQVVELRGASAGEFFIAHRSELVSVLKSLRRDFRVSA